MTFIFRDLTTNCNKFIPPAKFNEIYKYYKNILLFMKIYSHAFSPMLLPVYLFGVCFIMTTGSAALILFYKHMNIFITIMMSELVFFVAFGVICGFYLQNVAINLSYDLLLTLRRHCCTKSCKLKLNSLNLIEYNFASIFKTKSGTILTILSFISQNVISLVLLYYDSHQK